MNKFIVHLLASLVMLVCFVANAHTPPRFSMPRPSLGGFRTSTSTSRRSFSLTPSRSFTFTRTVSNTAPAPVSRPSAPAPAPRIYTLRPASTPAAAPAPTPHPSAPATAQPVVHNYHPATGSAGLSATDLVVAHALLSHRGDDNYDPAPGASASFAPASEAPRFNQVSEPRESADTIWRNCFLILAGCCVFAGVFALCRHATPQSLAK